MYEGLVIFSIGWCYARIVDMSMAISFLLEVNPVMSSMCSSGMPDSSLRNRIISALAFPCSGVAWMRIFTVPSLMSPVISFFGEPAVTLILSRMSRVPNWRRCCLRSMSYKKFSDFFCPHDHASESDGGEPLRDAEMCGFEIVLQDRNLDGDNSNSDGNDDRSNKIDV